MSKINEGFKNLLNKNEEDSYLAYLSKSGIRKTERYYDALAKANTDRALSSSDYGARAEYLSSSGLNSSGYEDYLKSRVEKKYDEKSMEAERQKSIDDYSNRSGYSEYLSEYEKLQTSISESVIKKISSGKNFDYKHALDEALRAGLSQDLAYTTASLAIKKAKENTVKQAINFARLNGYGANKAKTYALSLGLDERHANEVYEAISSLSSYEKKYFAQMSADEYYDYIQSQMNK